MSLPEIQSNFHIDIQDNLAILTLDMPGKVNILTMACMDELSKTLEKLHQQTQLKGLIIISAKNNNFIAGANIDEIANINSEEEAFRLASHGQQILQQIYKLPFPSLAAIHGTCLGGGTELALACTYRLATSAPETSIGLPEILLGIIPGFGGTQRLPRLIGCSSALDMILTGRRLNAEQARRAGLVDDTTSITAGSESLLSAAKQFMKSPARQRGRKRKLMQRLLDGNALMRAVVARQARLKVAASAKGYPAPPLAIEAIVHGLNLPLTAGLELEARYCAKLIPSPVSKNLIHVFKLSESVKKTSSKTAPNATVINHAVVLGAGIMGAGIAQSFANSGISTRLIDPSLDALRQAMQSTQQSLEKKVRQKQLNKVQANEVLQRLHPTHLPIGFGNADLLIEAIVEKMDVKKQVLGDMEKQLKPSCTIASNTSSLSITEMANALQDPSRLVGMHFFNPVAKMPLVEVIAGKQSSAEHLHNVYNLALQLKKYPIIVKDAPGFLVNRLLGFYLGEAIQLFEEGLSVDAIDQALLEFGMPMGPFRLMDVVGLDIIDKAQANLSAGLGRDRLPLSPLLAKVRDKNLLGEKGGSGFYRYEKGKVIGSNSDIESLRSASPAITMAEDHQTMTTAIWERPIYLLINEACRAIDEEIVANANMLDLGMIMGAGFPPWRGGLLRYANSLQAEKVKERLQQLAAKFGQRFMPHAKLLNIVNALSVEGKL